MERNKLAEIFRDTQNLYETNEKLKSSLEKSIENQKIYKESDSIEKIEPRFSEKAQIAVSKKRTFEAAREYAKIGRVCVLNFANSFNPGGGVVQGARAQEECLCRISTLYGAISQKDAFRNFYKPHIDSSDDFATDDVIFTPSTTVFKSDTDSPELLSEDEWFSADVLTCAAPNLFVGWHEKVQISDDALFKIFESRIRRILCVAALNKVDFLILGAFGCGAFGNPPEIVAAAFKKVIEEFCNSFKKIEFAVYCTPRNSNNFDAFSKTFA